MDTSHLRAWADPLYSNSDNGDDCWSLTSTQQLFRYTGIQYSRTDSLRCFCQRLMTKSMGVRVMVMKGGPVETLWNRIRAYRQFEQVENQQCTCIIRLLNVIINVN